MRACTDLWEPRAGNRPGPPGHHSFSLSIRTILVMSPFPFEIHLRLLCSPLYSPVQEAPSGQFALLNTRPPSDTMEDLKV